MARQSDGLGGGKTATFAIENGKGAALKSDDLIHLEEDRTDDLAQFKAAFQRVGNVEQQIQFIHHPATIFRRQSACPLFQPGTPALIFIYE